MYILNNVAIDICYIPSNFREEKLATTPRLWSPLNCQITFEKELFCGVHCSDFQ